MTTIMRGATYVREAIAQYLESNIPAIIDRARDDWGLDEYELPYPVSYREYEPYALDRYPLIGINVTSAGNFNRVDYDLTMSEKYLTNYTVRLFTWVRTPLDGAEQTLKPEYNQTIRLRDDMAAIVRAAILLSPSINNLTVLWDEDTLSEEYSEITPVKGDRFVAGVIHNFDLQVDESLSRNILGDADNISIDPVVLVGPGQEFTPYEGEVDEG